MEQTERAVEILKGLYEGGTLHIVGKGPSLRHLRAEHFGDGPVMTMNEAILTVQELKLSNHIYSMQKDGLVSMMVRPSFYVTLILQGPGYSEDWFPEHPKRLIVNPVDELGFEEDSVMSIRMCIALAKVMGCKRIIFLACDSLAGDYQTFDVQRNVITRESVGYYGAVVPQVFEELGEMEYEIVLPGAA